MSKDFDQVGIYLQQEHSFFRDISKESKQPLNQPRNQVYSKFNPKNSQNQTHIKQRSRPLHPLRPRQKPRTGSSKWLYTQKIHYLLFFVKEAIRRPYQIASWRYWKSQKIYPRMAQYLTTKNKKQCKSYDQRQKNDHHLSGEKLDIIPYAVKELGNMLQNYLTPSQIQGEIQRTLVQFSKLEKVRSQHMLLNQEMTNTMQECLIIMEREFGGKQPFEFFTN